MSEKKEMTNDQSKKTKMVKIKTLRDCKVDGKVLPIGQEAEVSEEQATALCDKTFRGPLDGTGEGSYKIGKIARAVRI